MAVTSLWRVKGYIGKVLLYAENPDKTTNPEVIRGADNLNRNALEDVIAYAGRESATAQKQFVWGMIRSNTQWRIQPRLLATR